MFMYIYTCALTRPGGQPSVRDWTSINRLNWGKANYDDLTSLSKARAKATSL